MKKKYVMRIGLSLLGICLSTMFMWIMWWCLPNFYLICLSANIENVVQVEFEIDKGWKLSVAGDNEMEPVKFLIDDPDTAKTFSEKWSSGCSRLFHPEIYGEFHKRLHYIFMKGFHTSLPIGMDKYKRESYI